MGYAGKGAGVALNNGVCENEKDNDADRQPTM